MALTSSSNNHYSIFKIGAITTAAAATAYLVYDTFKPRKNTTLPSPTRYPLIGNLPYIFTNILEQTHHETLDRGQKEFGDMFIMDMFGMQILQLSDAESIKIVLNSTQKLIRSNFITVLTEGIFKYALFVMPSDDTWKKHRKFLQPGFGPAHLRHGLEATNQTLDTLCDIWDAKLASASTSSIISDLFEVASSISVDVIGLVAFSYNYESVKYHETPAKLNALKAYNRAFEIVMSRSAIPKSLWWSFGLGVDKTKQEMQFIRETIMKAIQEKRASKQLESYVGGAHQDGLDSKMDSRTLKGMSQLDVLDRLLEVEGQWSDEEIIDEVIALFLAGGETTANAITHACFELSQNPEILAKVTQELDTHLGPPSSNPSEAPMEVSWDITNKLTYLEQVIKETLRLHAVLPVLPGREVQQKEGISIHGHHIAQGTIVSVNVRSLHRNPKYWTNPEKFDPSRWDNGFTPQPGTFMPFGDGQHLCLGYKLAMLELKCVLGRIFHRYRLRLMKDQNLKAVTTVTYGYKHGIKFEVERRKV
jgi:cytochrome P450